MLKLQKKALAALLESKRRRLCADSSYLCSGAIILQQRGNRFAVVAGDLVRPAAEVADARVGVDADTLVKRGKQVADAAGIGNDIGAILAGSPVNRSALEAAAAEHH